MTSKKLINYGLFGAVEANNVNATSLLLDQGADPNYSPKWFDNSLLHIALDNKQFKIIDLLLQYGAKPVDGFVDKIFQYTFSAEELTAMVVKHYNLDTKLMQNIFCKLINSSYPDRKILELLINYGLPVNDYIEWSSNEHCTPLHIAIVKRDMGFVKVLLKRGADIHKKTQGGDTCLSLAVDNDDLPMIKLFLNRGANVNEKIRNRKTVLFDSISDRVDRILLECGADVNVLDNDGNTPLTYTCDYLKKVLLVEQIAKLKFNDQEIVSKNLLWIEESSKLRNIFTECLKELQKMKNSKFYNDISFYDFFLMEKQIKRLALLTKRKDFTSAFKSSRYVRKFPHYGEDIQRIFEEAENKRDVVKAAEKKIYESDIDKAFSLPPKVMKLILSFTTNYLYCERNFSNTCLSGSEYEFYENESESRLKSECESEEKYYSASEGYGDDSESATESEETAYSESEDNENEYESETETEDTDYSESENYENEYDSESESEEMDFSKSDDSEATTDSS